MKILVLTDHWEPETNVPQRRWKWLAQVLMSQGHRVCVATPVSAKGRYRRGSVEDLATGETVLRTAGKKGAISLTRRAASQAYTAIGTIEGVIKAVLRGEISKPDLIIGTVPGLPTASVTHILATILRVPYALDVRDAWPDLLDYSTDWNNATGRRSNRERALSLGFRCVVIPAVRFALEIVYSRARFVWTTSERFASELQEKLRDRRNPPTIAVVRNVFPPHTVITTANRRRDKNELRVIYAGKLGRAQQLDNAVRAAHLAQKRGVPLKIRFIGSGVAADPLKSLADALQVDAEFLGPVDGDRLARHYLWADTALVHLAEWKPLSATVPSKTFELINSGIHITGVLSGEAAELIGSLSAGHAVPPGDPEKLAELWYELWRWPEKLTVGQDGKKWVANERNYEVPRTVKSLLTQLEDGAGNGRKTGN